MSGGEGKPEDHLLDEDERWLRQLSRSLADRKYDAYLKYLSVVARDPESQDGASQRVPTKFMIGAQDYILDGILNIHVQRLLIPDTRLYVCTLPIPRLDCLTIRAPLTGTPTIVLNHGIIHYTSYIVQIVMGLTGWAEGPMCEHHSVDELLDDLFGLANAITQSVRPPALELRTSECLTEHSLHNRVYDAFCYMAESFIILHELAHVSMDHLRPDDLHYEEIGPSVQVDVFSRRQCEEIEADTFAFISLREFGAELDLPERHIAYAVGCLLFFQHIVELVDAADKDDSHPPASARWAAILGALTSERPARSVLDDIEHMFWTFSAENPRYVGSDLNE